MISKNILLYGTSPVSTGNATTAHPLKIGLFTTSVENWLEPKKLKFDIPWHDFVFDNQTTNN